MRLLITLCSAFCLLTAAAQVSPYEKFGKITVEDLSRKAYSIDSSAPAVVLADRAESSVEGNTKGWFSSVISRHKVIHILAKPGYSYADMEVALYGKDGNDERLDEIKAVTYNLEGGKIVATKMERTAIFREKKDATHTTVKFTLPAVKEGSIIEVQYKVASDYYYQLDPWVFQHGIPTLWSEYNFSVPQFFTYTFMSHGYTKFFISDHKDSQGYFTVSDQNTASATSRTSFSSGVTTYRWVKKEIPAMKPESFTSSLDNYIDKMEFELSAQSSPLNPRSFRTSWAMLTKQLTDADYFGHNLNTANGWLNDEMKVVLGGATTDANKARRIFAYLRDNFSCTSHQRYTTDNSLKSVFKSHKGSVAEINLLLIAMLRHVQLNAEPMLLSRSQYGWSYDLYPSLARFNYLVCRLVINNNVTYLDASQSHLGFGRLLPECYNGHARIVNDEATPVYLMADSLRERKVTALFLARDAKGLWRGTMSQNPGYQESFSLRNRLQEGGKTAFFKAIQKEFGADVVIENGEVDSLSNYDEPIGLRYDIAYNPGKEDLLYINPMFNEGYKKNPFASAQRAYPVEMPYAFDETYILNLDIPEGYEIDELPKQMLAKYDEEGASFFEYRIQKNPESISMRSRIKLTRAFFAPEEYEELRAFFAMVVKKQGEQIVFKKKK